MGKMEKVMWCSQCSEESEGQKAQYRIMLGSDDPILLLWDIYESNSDMNVFFI